jgi:hypothetical protein
MRPRKAKGFLFGISFKGKIVASAVIRKDNFWDCALSQLRSDFQVTI